LNGRHFSSDAEVIAAAQICLDGQPSEFFFEWLAKVRGWSLYLFSFLFGIKTYRHPGNSKFNGARSYIYALPLLRHGMAISEAQGRVQTVTLTLLQIGCCSHHLVLPALYYQRRSSVPSLSAAIRL
jgi:hypothetical protein